MQEQNPWRVKAESKKSQRQEVLQTRKESVDAKRTEGSQRWGEAKGAIKGAFANLKDRANQIKDKVAAKVDQLGEKFEELNYTKGERAHMTWDSAKLGLQEKMLDKIASALEADEQSFARFAQRRDGAINKFVDFKDKAVDTTKRTGKAIGSAAVTGAGLAVGAAVMTAEAASDAARRAYDAGSDAAHRAYDAATDAKDRAVGAAYDAKDAVVGAATDAKDAVVDAKDALVSKTKEKGNDIKRSWWQRQADRLNASVAKLEEKRAEKQAKLNTVKEKLQGINGGSASEDENGVSVDLMANVDDLALEPSSNGNGDLLAEAAAARQNANGLGGVIAANRN